jgi:hypothetical protein
MGGAIGGADNVADHGDCGLKVEGGKSMHR